MTALRQHAGSTENRAAIVAELGVDKSMITHWMNGANIPKPDQVFAIEAACKLPGGFLSQHLGYVPVGASSISSAISSDETLTPRDRKSATRSSVGVVIPPIPGYERLYSLFRTLLSCRVNLSATIRATIYPRKGSGMLPLLIVLIVAGTSIWVLTDSTNLGAERNRDLGMAGTSPAAWFFGCLLFWIIVFPLYLYQRPIIKAAFADEDFEPDVKTCPRCAEHVKGAAQVCRFCGHEFASV